MDGTPAALLQSDVVILIANECDLSTLSRLARVSVFHSEIALDALWRELREFTVLRLVKLVPDTCFEPPPSNSKASKAGWVCTETSFSVISGCSHSHFVDGPPPIGTFGLGEV